MFCSYILITIKHEKLHTFVVATSMVQNIGYCQQQELCKVGMAGNASFDYLDVININCNSHEKKVKKKYMYNYICYKGWIRTVLYNILW